MFKKLTDNQLVQNVKDNSSSDGSVKELILRHSGIYISIVSSHFEKANFFKFGLELIEEKEIEHNPFIRHAEFDTVPIHCFDVDLSEALESLFFYF